MNRDRQDEAHTPEQGQQDCAARLMVTGWSAAPANVAALVVEPGNRI
jgi:hypothetical protein